MEGLTGGRGLPKSSFTAEDAKSAEKGMSEISRPLEDPAFPKVGRAPLCSAHQSGDPYEKCPPMVFDHHGRATFSDEN